MRYFIGETDIQNYSATTNHCAIENFYLYCYSCSAEVENHYGVTILYQDSKLTTLSSIFILRLLFVNTPFVRLNPKDFHHFYGIFFSNSLYLPIKPNYMRMMARISFFWFICQNKISLFSRMLSFIDVFYFDLLFYLCFIQFTSCYRDNFHIFCLTILLMGENFV